MTADAKAIPRAPSERRRRLIYVFLIGMVFVLFELLVKAVVDDVSGVSVSAPAFGYDFLAYYQAALRLIATGSPYQAITLAGPFQAGPQGLYLYSPLPAILAAPLTVMRLHDAATVYVGLQLLMVLGICLLMPVRWPVRFATLALASVMPAVQQDLNLGNVSLFITFMAVLGWRWLDRPAGAAAIMFATAVRPSMGLFAGWWLLRGRLRPLAWLTAGGIVLFLLTLPVVGLRGWFEYATVLRNLTGFEDVFRNWALNALAVRQGLPDPWPAVALFAGYGVSALAVLLSLRRDRELSYVVTLGATLLVSPLLWDHYMTNLLVPAAFLLSRGRVYGLVLPLLCYLNQELFPFVAVLAMVLPLTARSSGEPAGTILEPLRRWPPWRRWRAPRDTVTAPEPG